jgi:hypothetical protein
MLVSVGMAAGGGRATPTSATIRTTKKGSNCRKKGQKHCPHCLAIMGSNSDTREQVENSDEEFMATAEYNFKRCTRPHKDHF